LNGKTYKLSLNEKERNNLLHGGFSGFNRKVWKVEDFSSDSVTLSLFSPDGDEGFPANLDVKVTYKIDGSAIAIDYEATPDADTVIGMTNHAYFNLKGICNGTIEDHELQIFADATTPTDKAQIPTGEIKSVEGTPFDFRKPRLVGEKINADDEQIKIGKGYDHNWVLNNKTGNLSKAAILSEKTSGRKIEVWTTEPAIQIYCGNMIGGGKDQPNPITEKCGKILPYRGAICLETQHYPDSPNKPSFPSTILKPGEKYESVTEYHFGITK
jgi:aldose 1-epimerase